LFVDAATCNIDSILCVGCKKLNDVLFMQNH